MIGGKLKLKTSKKFEQALKQKRQAEEGVDVLQEKLAKQKEQELRKQMLKQLEEEEKDVYIEQPVQKGTGRFITSGTTVYGSETQFTKELEVGDFIIIENQETKEQERRKVSMVLSTRSCGIEEAFPVDIITKTEFYYQKKPQLKKKQEDGDEDENLDNKDQVDGQNKRFKSDKHPKKEKDSILEYQVKTGEWSYKTVKEKIKGEVKREDLLDMRVKKKTDKFCWF